MNSKTTNSELTEARKVAAKRIQAAVRKLEQRIAKLQADQSNDWGSVGSLNHIAEMLEQQ